jgi:antitoxin component YwqK of YwqJK toxin-antitoxin module
MFRDPKLRKLFMVFAAAYVVLAAVFLITADKPDPSQSAAGERGGEGAGGSEAPVSRGGQKTAGYVDGVPPEMDRLDQSPEGVKKVFYRNGAVSAEWISDGKPGVGGVLKAFYPGGTLWAEFSLAGGWPDGVANTYYSNGALWTLSNYRQGALSGMIQFFYPETGPWVEMRMEKGEVPGLPDFYSETGEIRKPPPISDREGSQYFKVFDARGDVITHWAQTDGSEENVLTTFYADGGKSSRWTMTDGRLHGTAQMFYSGEVLWREYIFEGGRVAGPVKSYYPDGSLWTEMELDGEGVVRLFRAFYPGGAVWFEMVPPSAGAETPVGLFSENSDGREPQPV